ncbi:GIY-YIG nuclease family protein [Flavobacterium fluviatile]|uniref:GIY-YIG nuclease family protein n=1 Tax=Flavobacterium fluviatile TaxID=1862387 RepID=UPI001FCC8800|nr:GIY-YIG nuclease family protein [Flavobacterium fluviatile]
MKLPIYFANVEIVASYNCYSLNVLVFESLLHRFFAEVCLDIDLYDKYGSRFIPREWFKVPLPVIDEVIGLLLNQSIVNYKYDSSKKKIILK